MRVSVIGTGYVGLVTGVCFAEKGHQVTCVDVDQAKVDAINNGVPPIHERGLQELLKKHVGGRLRASTDLSGAVQQTELSSISSTSRPSRKRSDRRCEISRAITS
jgi:UDPglucose 6-dehydrogenase